MLEYFLHLKSTLLVIGFFILFKDANCYDWVTVLDFKIIDGFCGQKYGTFW